MLARGLMQLTGGSWEVVAPLLALVLGGGAVLAIHQTVVRGAPRAVAARPGLPLASVALVSVFPTAAVLQVAYTEALALLLIASALLLLIRRDYGWMALVVVALGFTRAVALPMAAVVVVHAAVRWWSARRGTDTWTWRTGVGLGALTRPGGRVGLPVARHLRLGHGGAGRVPPDAGGVARGPRGRPVRRLVLRAAVLVRPRALLVVTLSFALVIAVLVVPAAWRLGNELHAWAAAYIVYIAAVVEPGSSLARFLLLAFPLAAVTAGVVTRPPAARRWWFGAVVVLMLGLQVLWVRQMWHANPVADWPP